MPFKMHTSSKTRTCQPMCLSCAYPPLFVMRTHPAAPVRPSRLYCSPRDVFFFAFDSHIIIAHHLITIEVYIARGRKPDTCRGRRKIKIKHDVHPNIIRQSTIGAPSMVAKVQKSRNTGSKNKVWTQTKPRQTRGRLECRAQQRLLQFKRRQTEDESGNKE